MAQRESLTIPAIALALLGVFASTVGAEPAGIPGSTTWSSQSPFFCMQGGDNRCRLWSDEITQTGHSVAPCGGLYLFHTHYYVLEYCGSIPWPE